MRTCEKYIVGDNVLWIIFVVFFFKKFYFKKKLVKINCFCKTNAIFLYKSLFFFYFPVPKKILSSLFFFVYFPLYFTQENPHVPVNFFPYKLSPAKDPSSQHYVNNKVSD
jgi:hypothetical protein